MAFEQITDTVGSSWDAPVISGDGSTVLYAPLHGSPLSVHTRPENHTFPLTYNTPDDHFDLNWDGTTVVFTAQADLVPGSNSDVSYEVFLWTRDSGFVQITDTADPHAYFGSISTNDQGSLVAFISNQDLVPGQNPHQADRLFVWNGATGELIQVTPSDSDYDAFAAMSGGNASVFFYSTSDLIPGGNPTGDFQIFAWECGLFRDSFVTGDTRRWTAASQGPGTSSF
jgi:hypothetical protein